MPGPAPLYHPQLTEKEVAQAHQVVQDRQAPHSQVWRAKLALLLHQEPSLANEQVAQVLGRHPNWVRKWRKRWVISGFTVHEAPLGRPALHQPEFTASQVAQAQELAQQHQAPHGQVQRAQLAVRLHQEPQANATRLAQALGRHPNWVYHWRKRWSAGSLAFTDQPGRGRKPFFTALEQALVKRLACELPRDQQLPLARYALSDLVRLVAQDPALRPMSRATIGRLLAQDAIKPWQHRCWLFPRDESFAQKARLVLDLYAGVWEGEPLTDQDEIISADEKTSIQARIRLHPSQPPEPERCLRYEHEYERGGALQYLAAWDVRRGKPMGLCVPKTGIEPFRGLVDLVMHQAPYAQAPRVFWIVDGGSSHRGEPFAQRLRTWYPTAIAVPLPTHASWLNQIEIYFSIVQRKVLTPNDFANLLALTRALFSFEDYYAQLAHPFTWRFTSLDLERWLERLAGLPPQAPP